MASNLKIENMCTYSNSIILVTNNVVIPRIGFSYTPNIAVIVYWSGRCLTVQPKPLSHSIFKFKKLAPCSNLVEDTV